MVAVDMVVEVVMVPLAMAVVVVEVPRHLAPDTTTMSLLMFSRT